MMKIGLEDASAHAGRVQQMLDYFGILDRADTESDQITPREIGLDGLRPDEARAARMPGVLHHTRDGYVRAPKI